MFAFKLKNIVSNFRNLLSSPVRAQKRRREEGSETESQRGSKRASFASGVGEEDEEHLPVDQPEAFTMTTNNDTGKKDALVAVIQSPPIFSWADLPPQSVHRSRPVHHRHHHHQLAPSEAPVTTPVAAVNARGGLGSAAADGSSEKYSLMIYRLAAQAQLRLEDQRQEQLQGAREEERLHHQAPEAIEAIREQEEQRVARQKLTDRDRETLQDLINKVRQAQQVYPDDVYNGGGGEYEEQPGVGMKTEAEMARLKFEQRNKLLRASFAEAKRVLEKKDDGQVGVLEDEVKKLEKQLTEARLLRLRKPEPEVVHVPLPSLTAEDEYEYDRLIHQPQKLVLVQHDRSGIDIKGHDMASLAPSGWLNDEVINLVISLLQERDMHRRRENANGSSSAPKCHFFSTFFMSKLYRNSGKYDYNAVRRWTAPNKLKNAGQLSKTILECDKIIIPVNQGNLHWVCAVIDIKNQKFLLYDSLQREDSTCLKNLALYVRDEFKNKLNEEREDVLDWPREFPQDIPQQLNGYDCGMFTLLFANYVSQGAALDFGQKDISMYRKKVVGDIMRLKID